VPPGADIYGVSGDVAGGYIAQTPHTFKFYGGGPKDAYRFQCLECGDDLTQVLEFSMEGGVLQRTVASIAFECLVIKPGYRPYLIHEIVQQSRSSLLYSTEAYPPLHGRQSFTAILVPLELGGGDAPKQQQQQQQQQQQNVIIGDPERGFGKLIISCNVDGAEISIDGIFVGNTPATLRLKDGIHIVEVKKPGYSPYRKEIRVLAESELSLRIELSRRG